jgi:hypothetical protein
LTHINIFAEDKGVVFDVLRLSAEIKVEEAIGLLIQNLSELVKKDVPTSKIYIDSGFSDGPELKLDEIDSMLNKAFIRGDWTYQKLIMQMRASCFSPRRKPLPDREEMTTQEIAEHFQVK